MDTSDICSRFSKEFHDGEPKEIDLFLKSLGADQNERQTSDESRPLEDVLDILHDVEVVVSQTKAFNFPESINMEPTPLAPFALQSQMGACPSLDDSLTMIETNDIVSQSPVAKDISLEPTPLASHRVSPLRCDRPSLATTLSINQEQETLLLSLFKPLMSQASATPTQLGSLDCQDSAFEELKLSMITSIGGSSVTAPGLGEPFKGPTGSMERRRFRPHQFGQWNERFAELVEYRNKNGHCLVPHHFPENPKLAQWTKRQRYQYKLKRVNRHSTLTDERQALLEKLGFVWDSHSSAWMERLESLKQFHAHYGHCNVPSKYADKTLAIWVKCQRRQYKLYKRGSRSTLSRERFLELEQLGFEWNPRNL